MRAAATIPIRCAPPSWRQEAGADGITAHLREDRRHISDDDIERLTRALNIPLNLEMAATDEMAGDCAEGQAACRLHRAGEARGAHHRGRHRRGRPAQPAGTHRQRRWCEADIRVSMFIEPDRAQLDATQGAGRAGGGVAHRRLCPCVGADRASLERIRDAAEYGADHRAGSPCRARPDLRQCQAHRRDRPDPRTQHRPLPGRGGGVHRPGQPRSGACMRA